MARKASLMRQAVHGFGWIVAWRMSTRALGMASTLVLVRLLTPADFGLMALSSSFLEMVDAFSELGIEDAVVRTLTPYRQLYDTAFTMIWLRSAVMAAVIAVGAVPAAAILEEPRLVPIILVTAALTLLSGFDNVRVLDFRRDMRFDREFQFQLVPRIAGVVATIVAAVILRDYWALVIGRMTLRLVRLPYSYVVRPFLPRPTLSAWRDLVGFSSWAWMVQVARLVRARVPIFVLGRVVGTASVGIISIAGEISALPLTELLLPMGRALFSAVLETRRAGGDPEVIWRRMVGLISIIVFPSGVGLALVAEPLVRLMLGPQWMMTVPIVQIFAVVTAFSVFDHCCHIQLDSSGLIHIDFSATCVTAMFRVILSFTLIPWFGLAGAVWGAAIAVGLDQIVYLTIKKMTLPFEFLLMLRQVWRPALATGGMAVVVVWSGLARLPEGADGLVAAVHLAEASILGAAVYTVALLIGWQLAGRPNGTETDIIFNLRQSWGRLLAAVRA